MKKEKETIGDKIYKRKECIHKRKECGLCHLGWRNKKNKK